MAGWLIYSKRTFATVANHTAYHNKPIK